MAIERLKKGQEKPIEKLPPKKLVAMETLQRINETLEGKKKDWEFVSVEISNPAFRNRMDEAFNILDAQGPDSFYRQVVVVEMFDLYKSADDGGKVQIERWIDNYLGKGRTKATELFYEGKEDLSFNMIGRPDYNKVLEELEALKNR